MKNNTSMLPLKIYVQEVLKQYFEKIDGAAISNLYQMIIKEVEFPLLKSVMDYTSANQSKAAKILGINRATLRKKLQLYKLI